MCKTTKHDIHLKGRFLRDMRDLTRILRTTGLDRRRILPKSPLVEAVRFESQDRPES